MTYLPASRCVGSQRHRVRGWVASQTTVKEGLVRAMETKEIGRFIKWGEGVTIDLVRKVMQLIPEGKPEKIVEIPNEDTPSEEALDLRCTYY